MKKLAELAKVRARWLKLVMLDTHVGHAIDPLLKSYNNARDYTKPIPLDTVHHFWDIRNGYSF